MAEISIHIGLEFVEQHLKFGTVKLTQRFHVRRINDFGTFVLHCRDGLVQQVLHGVADLKMSPSNSDARAFQTRGIEKPSVVRHSLAATFRRGAVIRIDSGQRAEQGGGIRDSARHRAGSVLRMSDGNNSGAAHQAQRRLDADNAVGG